jgi:hypothetical protein
LGDTSLGTLAEAALIVTRSLAAFDGVLVLGFDLFIPVL